MRQTVRVAPWPVPARYRAHLTAHVRPPLLALALLAALVSPAWAAYECWEIKDLVGVAFTPQARVFQADWRILANAQRGNGVLWTPGACLVTQRAAGANLSVDVAGCTVVHEGATATVTSGNVIVGTAHATLPRIDIISATGDTGVKTITEGTPATNPLPPTMPQSGGADNLSLAFVFVPATDTAITNNQITDKRACVNAPGGGGGGAPTTAKYWVETADAGLSSERVMGALATGLIQNTVTTGIPTTIAPTDDNIVIGSGTTWQLKALPTCSGGTDALAYNISTNTFACNTIATAGTGLSYLTKVAEGGLSNEFALASLATGILINTTTTGVPTILAAQASANQFVRSYTASGTATFSSVGIADHSASGTPSATTFYRGDNTWATPAGSGTVTTTGSPASGQIAVMSGATSITSGVPVSLGPSYLSTTKTAGTTGTTANLLVKIDTSGNVVTAVTSDVGALGIAATTASSTNPVEVATRGIVNCVADNTTVVGRVLIVGTTTAGRCRDSGQTDSTAISVGTQVIGKALTAVSAGSNVSVQLYGPGHYGAQAAGGGNVTAGTLTNNIVPKATGATSIANSLLTDNATTLTYTGTGGVSAPAVTVTGAGAGLLAITAGTAPATPAAGVGNVYVDSTSKNLAVKDDAGVVKHGVQADTGAANNFLTAISAAGLVSKAQPAFSNLSGNIAVSQMNSGTAASSSTYWRGDGTWVAPSGSGTVTTTGSPASGDLAAFSGASSITTTNNPVLTAIAAPSTPASGKGSVYVDSTSKKLCNKDDAGTVTCTQAAGGGGNPETWSVVATDIFHAQSSTTMEDVTGISVAICTTSTEFWQFEILLMLTQTGTAADWKWSWTFPTNVVMFWGTTSADPAQDHWGGLAVGGTPLAARSQTDTLLSGSMNGTHLLHLKGIAICSTTSGTLQLQFAQNTSSATQNTVKKGSLGIFRKIIP